MCQTKKTCLSLHKTRLNSDVKTIAWNFKIEDFTNEFTNISLTQCGIQKCSAAINTPITPEYFLDADTIQADV